jgi:hypothetical protein
MAVDGLVRRIINRIDYFPGKLNENGSFADSGITDFKNSST